MSLLPRRSSSPRARARYSRSVAALTLTVGLLACSEGTAPPGGEPDQARTVVLVVVDGLRGDALPLMPALWNARANATWTDSMRTVVPSVTFPGVLSILTGRDVTASPYNVRRNDTHAAAIAFVTTGLTAVMHWTRASRPDGTTAAVVGEQLAGFADPNAKALLAIDEIVAAGTTDELVIDAVLPLLSRANPPSFVFVHLGGVDGAGHSHGWISSDTTSTAVTLTSQYLTAVGGANDAIARLTGAVQSRISSGDVAVVITADHGGGHGYGEHCSNQAPEPARRGHCSANPGDVLVPLVILARPSAAAGRLPGQPSVTRVAATVARLLGVAAPAGVGEALPLATP